MCYKETGLDAQSINTIERACVLQRDLENLHANLDIIQFLHLIFENEESCNDNVALHLQLIFDSIQSTRCCAVSEVPMGNKEVSHTHTYLRSSTLSKALPHDHPSRNSQNLACKFITVSLYS